MNVLPSKSPHRKLGGCKGKHGGKSTTVTVSDDNEDEDNNGMGDKTDGEMTG